MVGNFRFTAFTPTHSCRMNFAFLAVTSMSGYMTRGNYLAQKFQVPIIMRTHELEVTVVEEHHHHHLQIAPPTL